MIMLIYVFSVFDHVIIQGTYNIVEYKTCSLYACFGCCLLAQLPHAANQTSFAQNSHPNFIFELNLIVHPVDIDCI